MTWLKIERPLFTLSVFLLLAAAIQISREWSVRASIIILVLGGIGLVLAIAQLISDFRNISSQKTADALTMEAPALATGDRWANWEIWGWILGFYAAIQVVGFLAAVPLFVLSYTKVNGGGWLLAVLMALVSWGFVFVLFDILLHVPWPEPLLGFSIF